jgi:hypothetical protein
VPLDARRRRGRWTQATLILIAAAAAVFLWLRGSDDDQKVGAPPPPHSARALREEALEACDQARWDACKAKLDEARELDPAGEEDPRVQKARRAIEAAHPGE